MIEISEKHLSAVHQVGLRFHPQSPAAPHYKKPHQSPLQYTPEYHYRPQRHSITDRILKISRFKKRNDSLGYRRLARDFKTIILADCAYRRGKVVFEVIFYIPLDLHFT